MSGVNGSLDAKWRETWESAQHLSIFWWSQGSRTSSPEGLHPGDGLAELWLHGPPLLSETQWSSSTLSLRGPSSLIAPSLFPETSINGVTLYNSPSPPVLETPVPTLTFMSLAESCALSSYNLKFYLSLYHFPSMLSEAFLGDFSPSILFLPQFYWYVNYKITFQKTALTWPLIAENEWLSILFLFENTVFIYFAFIFFIFLFFIALLFYSNSIN